MSDQKKMTRRMFNITSFSAGLAALGAPSSLLFAQEQQQALSKKPVTRAPQQIQERKPTFSSPDYRKLKLVTKVNPTDTHLELQLYINNTSKKSMSLPHTMGNVPLNSPTVALHIMHETYPKPIALEVQIPHEDLRNLSRAAHIDYLDVPPTKNKPTFFSRFVCPWPENVIKDRSNVHRYDTQVELTLVIDSGLPLPRTGENFSTLKSASSSFTIPKTITQQA